MDFIQQAVDILRNGGLIALPTETVYGLGADAANVAAIEKIFQAKQRPADHPLIVHIGSMQQLSDWAVEISEDAYRLADYFWPGPLTLILKKASHVNDLITGGQDTIGLRVPNHAVALAVLKAFGGGVAAPSANRFGRISPTTAEAVFEELGSAVDLILEGGQCEVGLESTIVDMTGEKPVILRPGVVTEQQIHSVLHKQVGIKQSESPRVSGSLESHYAPTTPTSMMSKDEMQKYLNESNTLNNKNKFAIMGFGEYATQKMPKDAQQYGHDLYQTLRDLDRLGFDQIIVESVPDSSDWDAIRDRLQRATKR